MAIEEFEDWAFLWGYGHALYATRTAGGTLFIYDGWHGYSTTTSTHINKLKRKAEDSYGPPRADGDRVRVSIDGEGGGGIIREPPKGRELIIVDDRPGMDYGRLDAEGRDELAEFDDRHLKAPGGYS